MFMPAFSSVSLAEVKRFAFDLQPSVLLESAMTPKEHLIECVKRLCASSGGPESVAEKAGISVDNLKQILAGTKLGSGNPRGVGPMIQRKLDDAFPGWSMLTSGAQSPKGGHQVGGARMSGLLAQNLSQLEPIIEPNTISWESILSAQPLPPAFKLALPDDALAPAYPAGALFIWSTSKPARTGSVVLVRDSFGQPHVRLHAQGRTPGQWIAQATGPGFQPFDGASVTLLAVAEEERRPMP